MQPDILELENFLPYRLNRLAEAVSREFSKLYRDWHDLTRPEWRTLATLGRFGAMTATAIGEHSTMHKTKVSRAVSELEKRKWLARAPDEADRRIEHLSLTKAGAAIYREMVPLAKAYETRLLERMAAPDCATLLQAIDGIEAALGLHRPGSLRQVSPRAGDTGRAVVSSGEAAQGSEE